MIEGLQLFPWWHEAIRRDLLGSKAKCETCMKSLNEEQRHLAGCGFLPQPAEHLRVFVEAWNGLGYKGPKPTTCPGYTTGLPETIEIVRARMHWDKGDVRALTLGAHPTEGLRDGIEIVNTAICEFQMWSATPAKDGGGGS